MTSATATREGAPPDLGRLDDAQLNGFRAEAERLAQEAEAVAEGLAELAPGSDDEQAEQESMTRFAKARAVVQQARVASAQREQERRQQARQGRLGDIARSIEERPSDAERIAEHIRAVEEAFAGLRLIAEERQRFVAQTSAAMRAAGVNAGSRGGPGLWHSMPATGWAVGIRGRHVELLDPNLIAALAIRRAFNTSVPSGFTLPHPAAAAVEAPDIPALIAVLRRHLGETA